VIGRANGVRIGITGLGVHVPARVVTNDDLAQYVETSDEWIRERTGIRERRMASREEALSDIALPAAREALEEAGISGSDLDLVIVATVTPDMAFPASSALIADALGASEAGAYDLSAGCTGFMYAVAQAYGMLATGHGVIDRKRTEPFAAISELARSHGATVAVVGLDDVIIIDTPDALLISSAGSSQDVKRVVDRLRDEGRDDLL